MELPGSWSSTAKDEFCITPQPRSVGCTNSKKIATPDGGKAAALQRGGKVKVYLPRFGR